MRLDAISHSQAEFSIEALVAEDALVLRLIGDTSAGTECVTRAFSRLHEETLARKRREVTVDLRELQFMNSAGFKSFVMWLSQIQALPDEQRYHVKVLSNPRVYWQSRSLKVLVSFAEDLLEVVPEG